MLSKPLVVRHAYKHGLSKRDILHAWKNAYVETVRSGPYPPQHVLIGPDTAGRDLQLLAVWNDDLQRWVIFHAMPATRKAKRETGLM